MNAVFNKEAENFYMNLIQNHAIQDNQEVYQRLTELSSWQYAFITLLKHASKFGLKINSHNLSFWTKTLEKNDFSKEQIKEIISLINNQ